MHIVTFYSYKGGVGRTMALVNTAAALVRRGRRVLIVDFDLEAPGISTYAPFSCMSEKKGVVEYVGEYMATSVAPKASEFIVECKLGDASIWAMPAGQRNRDYSSNLNAIDWQSLYSVHNGYLFFEDLKLQWKAEKFDYVLIDSRTGHTDVGGICTRQLPDAVVLMFFPNDQNLLGLESVVRDIREEPRGLRPQDIILHFCASNVPDLDDEEHILERKLSEAKKCLKYTGNPVLIHHYNSLSLLEQSVFVLDRPESKLAAEYNSLVAAIVSRNLEDREGALATLLALRDQMRNRIKEGDGGGALIDETLLKIKQLHPNDGEIAWVMAHIYSLLGDLGGENDRLSVAIEQNISTAMARRRRAAIARLQDRHEDALADLQAILTGVDTTGFEFVAAVELLREVDTNWISIVAASPILQKIEDEQLLRLAEILMSDPKGNELVVSLMRGVMSRHPRGGKLHNSAYTRLILALISSRQFDAAIAATEVSRAQLLETGDMCDVFNYAMAEWGIWGTPPKDMMDRVLKSSQTDLYRDANRYQCLSLAAYICGETMVAWELLRQSRAIVERLSGRVFSCWRYLELSRPQMREDLDAMGRYFEGRGPGPEIFNVGSERAVGQLLN